jgi:predicted O-linked N-acetylglucosamine transferase (SPINDLY family)
MGTPVVTLAGAVHASRVGVSLLNNAGMPELVAQMPEQYCAIATELAGDLAALTQRRAAMRDLMHRHPLTDGIAGARDFEKMCRTLWTNYCNGSEQNYDH